MSTDSDSNVSDRMDDRRKPTSTRSNWNGGRNGRRRGNKSTGAMNGDGRDERHNPRGQVRQQRPAQQFNQRQTRVNKSVSNSEESQSNSNVNNRNTLERLDSVHYVHGVKRFYFDVCQNSYGIFCKLSQIRPGMRREWIYISLDASKILLSNLASIIDFNDDTSDTAESRFDSDDDKAQITLKTLTFNDVDKRYTIDLKENRRGRFVRIMQMSFVAPGLPVLFIPIDALAPITDRFRQLLDRNADCFVKTEVRGGEVNGDARKLQVSRFVTLPNSKSFFFACKENANGRYLMISEIKGSIRNTIVVPEDGNQEFLESFTQCVDSWKTQT